jgi:2-polyprenyl-3-methyl-5-hydroxy-6-metoxy-1,4-benzoquinol methylase
MQRTIEKLAHERSEKQEALRGKLLKIRERAQALDRLEHDLQAKLPGAAPRKKGWFARFRPDPPDDGAAIRDFLSVAVRETKALSLAAAELIETGDALADARDKEWDALGSNHVGMIFKSMEWRVDKLAASTDDASALMRTFVLLKEQLVRLTSVLEEKNMPSPATVREVLDPIEDLRYTGFENRFRGSEPEVRKQQEKLAGHFRPGGKVLDLGCGRGEFLEILKSRGISGSGVDANGRMVKICRDKGLDVRRADILEALAGEPDGSLDGVFSSQVIEHLAPATLKRMIELAYAKLAPGGVLLLETVNPTSVFALVQIYFLDMTHRQPVHPQALNYLMESSGFEDVAIEETADLAAERLQPVPGADAAASVLNRDIDRLNALLFAAPNYAAVGKKK